MTGVVAPTAVSDPALLDTLAASLDYQSDLFETLAWYRSAFLRYYQWLDTGDRAAADPQQRERPHGAHQQVPERESHQCAPHDQQR